MAVDPGQRRPIPNWDYDGKRIVGNMGNDICLWDASNGRLLKKLVGNAEQIVFVQFSPDGKYALSSSGTVPEDQVVLNSNFHIISKDTSTRIWDLHTGKQLQCWMGQISAGFDPSGKHIITYLEAGKGSNRLEAAISETLTGRLISKSLLDPYFYPINRGFFEFSPDGRSYLIFDGDLVLCSASSGQEISRIRNVGERFRFIGSNSIVIFSTEAIVWDFQTNRIVQRIKAPSKGANPGDSTSDGRKFIGVWPRMTTVDVETGSVTEGAAPGSGAEPRIMVRLVSPDNKRYAIEFQNKDGDPEMAELFNVDSCQKMATIDLGDGGHIIAFSPDGSTLLTGGSSFRVYASKDGKLLHEFKLLGDDYVRKFGWSNRW